MERLDAFDGPIPEGQTNRRYEGFVSRITQVGSLSPRDRLGNRFLEAGITEETDLQDEYPYTVDIELWDFGERAVRERKAKEIEEFIAKYEGTVHDQYIGPSITLLRATALGKALRNLLEVPEIAYIDLPPVPDLEAHDFVHMESSDAPSIRPADPDAPVIGVLDSGLNEHPFLVQSIAGLTAFPTTLGLADVWGHGTRVAGVAAFGDLRKQLQGQPLQPSARIVSAKVLNDDGNFFERQTLPGQMREAITRLHEDYGCRIFVISLGDFRACNKAGRVGPWAATLDELVRELDILIFVSTGNRTPRKNADDVEEGVTKYPGYLLEANNRLFEPAGAVNVITVGSLANGSGTGARHEHEAHVRQITDALEPSPFTRIGPSAGGITKPDFVDLGGTLVFDAPSARLQGAPLFPEAGIITLNHNFLRQLLTSGHGTSYSAPMLANKAAYLLQRFPWASANLIRALLAGAAMLPESADRVLKKISPEDKVRICGNGLVDTCRATYSDDHRVVFYAEERLEINQFAVYRVSIPTEFQQKGRRTIRVSLAFDPPVRHTRTEYIGTKMNFRLLRGCEVNDVFEHFRSRSAEEGDPPNILDKFKCKLEPKSKRRDRNTLQTASKTYRRSTADYGDEYYLVVRCLGGWAEGQEVFQNFAVVVELECQPEIQIYARLRQRARV
ncbi:MAG: S8 family peptidase [Rhodobacteraceae bacterium]|nr:S8 family peptidase [Paracoccaceae bacterium]